LWKTFEGSYRLPGGEPGMDETCATLACRPTCRPAGFPQSRALSGKDPQHGARCRQKATGISVLAVRTDTPGQIAHDTCSGTIGLPLSTTHVIPAASQGARRLVPRLAREGNAPLRPHVIVENLLDGRWACAQGLHTSSASPGARLVTCKTPRRFSTTSRPHAGSSLFFSFQSFFKEQGPTPSVTYLKAAWRGRPPVCLLKAMTTLVQDSACCARVSAQTCTSDDNQPPC